jgi:hypothetical protein
VVDHFLAERTQLDFILLVPPCEHCQEVVGKVNYSLAQLVFVIGSKLCQVAEKLAVDSHLLDQLLHFAVGSFCLNIRCEQEVLVAHSFVHVYDVAILAETVLFG